MKNVKMTAGAASVLGAMLATTVLAGCTSTSGGATTASGGTSSAAASSSAGGASGGAGGGSTASASGAAGGSSTATSNGGGSGSGTNACADANLKITTSGTGAAASHTGWVLVFTNTGSSSCTIEGYPGAGVTDASGQVVLNATRQQTGYLGGQYPSPATITLAPGAAASTVLEWVDAPANGQAPVGANCPGMDSGKVLITPPNTKQSTSFPAPADLCTLFEVHPVVSGTSGRA